MGHFSYYERIPHTTGTRGSIVRMTRRILRRLLWPIFLNQELRSQKVYDAMQAIRAEQRRLDAQACKCLSVQRRLDFMEKAIANLQSPGLAECDRRSNNSGPPRARCA
jgi:hypothetical protein